MIVKHSSIKSTALVIAVLALFVSALLIFLPWWQAKVTVAVTVVACLVSLALHSSSIFSRAAAGFQFFAVSLATLKSVGYTFTLPNGHTFSLAAEHSGSGAFWISAFLGLASVCLYSLHFVKDQRDKNREYELPTDQTNVPSFSNRLAQQRYEVSREIRLSDEHLVTASSDTWIKLVEDRVRLEIQLENIDESTAKGSEVFQTDNRTQDGNQQPLPTYEAAVNLVGKSKADAISALEVLANGKDRDDIRVHLTLAGLYMSVLRLNECEGSVERALEIDPNNLYARNHKAYLHNYSGEYEQAELLLLDIVKSQQAQGKDVSLEYNNLGALMTQTQRFPAALMYFNLSLREIGSGGKRTDKMRVMLFLAGAEFNCGYPLQAQKIFLEITQAESNLEDSDWVRAYSNFSLGKLYFHVGRISEAKLHLLKSVNIFEKLSAGSYFHIEDSFELLKQIYTQEDNIQYFIDLLDVHVEVFKEMPDATELVRERGLRLLARLYLECDRYEKVIPLYEESISLMEEADIPDVSEYCASTANLGRFLRIEKRLNEAETQLRKALKARIDYKGRVHVETALTMKNLAGVLRVKGSDYHLDAKKLYDDALKIRRVRLGENNISVANLLTDIAVLDGEMEDFDQANSRLDLAYEIYRSLGFPERHSVMERVSSLRNHVTALELELET